MSDEHQQRLEQMASAIEDLLYMGAISIREKEDKALLSPQFSLIVSNVMSSMKLQGNDSDEAMKLMYFSLLIYMNEHLKVPKSLMMALGNDLEKNQELESGRHVATYVSVLAEIWAQNKTA